MICIVSAENPHKKWNVSQIKKLFRHLTPCSFWVLLMLGVSPSFDWISRQAHLETGESYRLIIGVEQFDFYRTKISQNQMCLHAQGVYLKETLIWKLFHCFSQNGLLFHSLILLTRFFLFKYNIWYIFDTHSYVLDTFLSRIIYTLFTESGLFYPKLHYIFKPKTSLMTFPHILSRAQRYFSFPPLCPIF